MGAETTGRASAFVRHSGMSDEAAVAAIANRWVMVLALASAVVLPSPQPAAALTSELAKLCRSMAIRAHPTARPGSAGGSAGAQRAYFQQCVENNGKMPDDASHAPASQPPK